MRKAIVAIALCCLPHVVLAQTDVLKVIGALIRANNIVEADKRIAVYIAKYPNDVDVLMMKGNVELNRWLTKDDAIELKGNEDESIFDPSMGSIGAPRKTISKQGADSVEKYWKRALTIDPSRDDIHKGLCYLYGMSSQTEKLINYLPTLRKHVSSNSAAAYSMGDYARLIEERGPFDNSIRVYKAIARLYPNCAGIYSDIASEYFRKGRMDDAQMYIDSALLKDDADTMVYGNAYFMNTIWGNYDEALSTMKKASASKDNKDWLFTQLLMAYANGEPKWRALAQQFLHEANAKSLGKEITITKVLLEETDKNRDQVYEKIINIDPFASDDVLIQKRWMSILINDPRPALRYGLIECKYRNYKAAIPVFAKLELGKASFSKQQQDSIDFFYAWSLYDSGEKKESMAYWKNLLSSSQFYMKSAAAYFSGKQLLDSGNKVEAMKAFKQVSEKASDSKYANYCYNLIKVNEK